MNASVRITCLIDNATGRSDLQAEHGLAFLVEVRGHLILFDTGQSGLLLSNACALGFDLSRVSFIVLSHGHFDHTGGLTAVLNTGARGTLLAHPAAFGAHYSATSGRVRPIGLPKLTPEQIRQQGWKIVWTDSPTALTPGVLVSGPITRHTAFAETSGPFFLDAQGCQSDPISDDQALILTTRQGVVVLLGCAHAGVVNTLSRIRQIAGNAPIHALIGGMHLRYASPQRLAATMEALASYGVQCMAPCHCTGPAATAMLWGSFPHRCQACQVGSRFEFDL